MDKIGKILCICECGNSRSVALAWILKDHLHLDAIAIGMKATSDETKQMLYDWANVIVIVDEQYASEVPDEFQHKVNVWHVGADRYFRGFDIGLLNTYADYIHRSGLAPRLLYSQQQGGPIKVEVTKTMDQIISQG